MREKREKNAKLEKLEKIKSEFVSVVSHELRTPLTPINNSLDIVLSGSAGEINDDIKNALVVAMKNKDQEKVNTLRLVQAAIKQKDIDAIKYVWSYIKLSPKYKAEFFESLSKAPKKWQKAIVSTINEYNLDIIS